MAEARATSTVSMVAKASTDKLADKHRPGQRRDASRAVGQGAALLRQISRSALTGEPSRLPGAASSDSAARVVHTGGDAAPVRHSG
jgi:hypothetical protein